MSTSNPSMNQPPQNSVPAREPHEERRFLDSVLRSSLDMIIATDNRRRIQLFNDAAVRQFGYTRDEVIGQPITMLYADPLQMQQIFDSMATFESFQGEVLNKAKDGRIFTSLVSAATMHDDAGRVTGYMGVSRDVTQLRRSERAQRYAENRYRDIVASANSIILRWDHSGNITFLNEYGLRFFGFEEHEILGRNVIGTIIPETEVTGRDLTAMIENIQLHPERYENNENQNMRKDGTRVWVSWTNKRIRWDPDGPWELLSIGNDISALKEIECALNEKTNELAKANAALMDSNEMLKVTDRMKSVFIASMSHELRTPLNSIIGFSGILLQQMPGPLNDEQAKQLTIVRDSARHLLGLINEVLDISKIEAGRVDLEISSFALATLVDEVLASLGAAADAKSVTLRNDINLGLVLTSDRARVRQVLLNLAGNAVKFIDQGEVSVSVAVHGEFCSIAVRDTGPGIAAENMSMLFHPFQQVDMSLTRKHSGTGLGLYLTKKLSALLGGSVSAASKLGEGSVFTVVLPLAIQKGALHGPDAAR